MVWRLLKYLQHQFYRRHRKGYGIHSPYLFEFVSEVIFNRSRNRVPEEITAIHRHMRSDRSLIPEGKLGLTANVVQEPARSVRSFTRVSSVPEKYGALLYRISRWFRPDYIIELGTGVGISALYLGHGYKKAPLHSIEGNTDRAAFAAQMLSRSGLEEVSIHWGSMDEKLELLLPSLQGRILAFVDGNHQRAPTLYYTRSLLDRISGEGILILHDIYWSRDMQEAWKEVSQWPEIDASIDLYYMGILLCRPGLTKSRIRLKF